MFQVLRTSGLIKEISANSVSIENDLTGDSNPQPFDCQFIALSIELI